MAKKDFFYNSVKAKNLLILTAVLILSLAFSSKSEQNQKEQKVQKLVLSEDSQNKLMKLFQENIRYPDEALNKEISGRFFVIIKTSKGGKINNITVNDKDNSVNVPLIVPHEIVIVGKIPLNNATNKDHSEYVTKDLAILENEGIRVTKMIESLKLPEFRDESLEFAIPLNFKLTKD
jgi:hypothetical protein